MSSQVLAEKSPKAAQRPPAKGQESLLMDRTGYKVRADSEPAESLDFLDLAVLGLQSPQPTLPYALLYDTEGSTIFEHICALDDYYPTREERKLILAEADRIVQTFPPNAVIVELGCGSASKTKHILQAYIRRYGKAHFVALDISAGALQFAADELRGLLGSAQLEVTPVCADYLTGMREVARRWSGLQPIVVLWLGGSVGNMVRSEAAQFLRQVNTVLRPAVAVVGIDVWKDPATLYRAYHDRDGLTERFIRNILARLNTDLQADFQLQHFEYDVEVNEREHRVEMYLRATQPQRVTLHRRGRTATVQLAAGQRILVEYSHKYTVEEVQALSAAAGLHLLLPIRSDMFSVNVFVPRLPSASGA